MKSNQKLTVLFWHRKSKADNKGLAPIICRISIDGSDVEFSIGKKVHRDYWDPALKCVISGPHAKQINKRISEITTDLDRHFAMLQLQHRYVTPIMVRNAFNGLAVDHKQGFSKRTAPVSCKLLELTDKYIEDFQKMVDKGLRSSQTLRQWRATRNKIQEFIRQEYRVTDIEVIDIEYSFATRFYRYLTMERESVLQEAAAKKQIKNTKQILTLAESEGFVEKNPIQRFRCGGDDTDIMPLEFDQVRSIWEKHISLERLLEVRDVFIFQCFTGFAFQDVFGLSPSHIIKIGLKQEKWIIKERGKTGVPEMVPVMPIVQEIIDKYNNHPCRVVLGRLLPVNSNSRYNGYLKEIAVLCGLQRELNTHLARHTFADMMLNVMGFSLEEVSKMLGHRTIRTTQRYAKVKKNKISKTWETIKENIFTQDGKLRKIS